MQPKLPPFSAGLQLFSIPNAPSNLHAVLHQYAFFTSGKWALQDHAGYPASQGRKAAGVRRDESGHRESPGHRASVSLRAQSVRKALPVRPDPLALRVNPGLKVRSARKASPVRQG